jgi:hypothetical protein
MYGMRRGEEWARELSVDILAMGEHYRLPPVTIMADRVPFVRRGRHVPSVGVCDPEQQSDDSVSEKYDERVLQ